MEQIVRRHMTFSGWVQGVGFRYRCRHAAAAYGCTGWMCNESDGTVTVEIQGTEESIEKVIEAIERGSFIRNEKIETVKIPVVPEERDFDTLG